MPKRPIPVGEVTAITLHGLYSNVGMFTQFNKDDVGAVYYSDFEKDFKITVWNNRYGYATGAVHTPGLWNELRAAIKKACKPYSTLNHKESTSRPMLGCITIYVDASLKIVDFDVAEAPVLGKAEKSEMYLELEHYGIF